LGVRENTLTDDEKTHLDKNGYVPLLGVIPLSQVNSIKEKLEELAEEEGDQAGVEAHFEKGVIRVSDLVNKDPLFEHVFTHPRILAGINHVLKGDLKLSSLNGRKVMPGEGLQELHTDWHKAVEAAHFQVCNSIWLLDDFIAENGSTRLVPGSHISDKRPKDVLENCRDAHPDQIILQAPAGTVVLFNSHTFHGGTLNRTNQPSWRMHCYFTRRENPYQTDQQKYLRPETQDRLSEAALSILGINPMPICH